MFLLFIISAITFFAFCFLLNPFSQKLGLIDHPNSRKQHIGQIPVIGGIAIYTGIALTSVFFVDINKEIAALLIASGLLTMTGALDDRFDLNVKIRLVVQFLSALIAYYGANVQLHSFGNILGFGDIDLGILSLPISIFAIMAVINAFNMIDGIDGLSGGLALVSLITLYFLLKQSISPDAIKVVVILMGALTAYLTLNLSMIPQRILPKIFMGDAGSTLLGFVIAAYLIRYSQGNKEVIKPVTALWVIAIPLMDLLATYIRRVRHKKSPFTADRTHIHHIFTRAGFTPRATLIAILFTAILISSIVYLHSNLEYINFILFLIIYAIYSIIVSRAWKFAKYLKRKKKRLSKSK